eukprot:CAMPEP_0185573032 /NCGR_PEP_ID=MMETSP0434-20130131/4849_1 /TAXON_ID=626734 ORGANISM="Favella taraikaensis, Strain Fe Narragansett Bay" /NCGR_SAMPLE_ID=MMETSP0434 /ASSEMBLY_ACC=CAM_ASM_000379 /LENGTH=175 /DNA_ID=CAMNT_0028189127 /DNA_START=207 /DNA_END=734 /DNA_ORIENTATION=+
MFRRQKSRPDDDSQIADSKSEWHFSTLGAFKQRSVFEYLCCSSKRARHRVLMNEAEKKMRRQLDLRKFMRRFRLNTIASMSVLDWRSKHVAHMLSQMVLKDPDHHLSDGDPSSGGDKSAAIKRDSNRIKIAYSRNVVSKRLRALQKLQQQHLEPPPQSPKADSKKSNKTEPLGEV